MGERIIFLLESFKDRGDYYSPFFVQSAAMGASVVVSVVDKEKHVIV